MLSYIHSAIQTALDDGPDPLAYETCLSESKLLWKAQYVVSNFAKRYEDVPEQIYAKAERLFDTDWKAQYMLLSKDTDRHKEWDQIYKSCKLENAVSFSYIMRAFADEALDFYDNNSNNSNNVRYVIRIEDEEEKYMHDWRTVPYRTNKVSFPDKATFMYFCTYLKDKWCHCDGVPNRFRDISLFHISSLPTTPSSSSSSSSSQPQCPTIEMTLQLCWKDGTWSLNHIPVLNCENHTVCWHDQTLFVSRTTDEPPPTTSSSEADYTDIVKTLPQPIFYKEGRRQIGQHSFLGRLLF